MPTKIITVIWQELWTGSPHWVMLHRILPSSPGSPKTVRYPICTGYSAAKNGVWLVFPELSHTYMLWLVQFDGKEPILGLDLIILSPNPLHPNNHLLPIGIWQLHINLWLVRTFKLLKQKIPRAWEAGFLVWHDFGLLNYCWVPFLSSWHK